METSILCQLPMDANEAAVIFLKNSLFGLGLFFIPMSVVTWLFWKGIQGSDGRTAILYGIIFLILSIAWAWFASVPIGVSLLPLSVLLFLATKDRSFLSKGAFFQTMRILAGIFAVVGIGAISLHVWTPFANHALFNLVTVRTAGECLSMGGEPTSMYQPPSNYGTSGNGDKIIVF